MDEQKQQAQPKADYARRRIMNEWSNTQSEDALKKMPHNAGWELK
jgi:hypothetical protein